MINLCFRINNFYKEDYNMNENDNIIWTEKDIEKFLSISHKQAKAMIRTCPAALHFGATYRVFKDELLAWLRKNPGIKLDYTKI